MQDLIPTTVRSISTLAGLALALAPLGCDGEADRWTEELEESDALLDGDEPDPGASSEPDRSERASEQEGLGQLVAEPDTARACCIETCSHSSNFCYDSVVDEHYDRCQDAVIAGNIHCSNPPNAFIEANCHDDLNDCLGFGASWGATNSWAINQFSGCEAGFSNCISTCPV